MLISPAGVRRLRRHHVSGCLPNARLAKGYILLIGDRLPAMFAQPLLVLLIKRRRLTCGMSTPGSYPITVVQLSHSSSPAVSLPQFPRIGASTQLIPSPPFILLQAYLWGVATAFTKKQRNAQVLVHPIAAV